MMNNFKFLADLNYKLCSSVQQRPYKPKINIYFFKINNRLSYMRCLLFIEKFFVNFSIKHISRKTRTSKIKNYYKFSFGFNENFRMLCLIANKLPEPEITLIGTQYIITFNFYRFVIEIPVFIQDYEMLLKIIQIFSTKCRNT